MNETARVCVSSNSPYTSPQTDSTHIYNTVSSISEMHSLITSHKFTDTDYSIF